MQQQIQIITNKQSLRVSTLFQEFICKRFDIKDISSIHKTANHEVLIQGTDQATYIHKAIYSEFDKDNDSPLVTEYRLLAQSCASLLREQTGVDSWCIQRYPSFRVQFPNNVSVFEFHRDSNYNHPLGEVNHFLAINECRNTSALWVEETLGWSDVKPLNLKKGEIAKLNTSIFLHGDKQNLEGYTRMSIDFRLIPTQVLENEVQKTSLSKNIAFNSDNYFMLCP
tara:strand:- start:3111 stop:3785 length:675 start_codon:yes stop_codon:yes gene_type:complete